MKCFKGKQFEKDIVLIAVDYYCCFLSCRDVAEILKGRGVSVHLTTIILWVLLFISEANVAYIFIID
ncbi:hypothetical protein AB3X48_00950, partial [Bacillus sp. S4]